MAELRQRKKGKSKNATAEEFCPEVVQSNSGAISTVSLVGIFGAIALVWFYVNGDPSQLISKANELFRDQKPTSLTDLGSDEFQLNAMKLSEIDCSDRFPLFEINPDLRKYNMSITTSSPLALEYFNEGMLIASGFVHDEARRSFRAALKIDPKCAMCYWGVAYVTSADINRPIIQEWLDEATEATKQAVALIGEVDLQPVEVALIKAMAKRYPAERTLKNGAEYEEAFAQAMKPVADMTEDGNIQSVYCEALMDTMPWDYWVDLDTPKEKTKECFRVLDKALVNEPDNMLALHLYIHIYEASNVLDIAEKKADHLQEILKPTPSLGHLTHMPGHIFQRVGRHADAIRQNIQAWNVAEKYFAKCDVRPESGYNSYYAVLYYPHRHAFVVYSATMTGKKELALKVIDKMYKDCIWQLKNVPWFHMYSAYPEMTQIRFGDWDAVLALPKENDHSQFAQAMRLFGLAFANIGKGNCKAAEELYADFAKIATNAQFRDQDIFFAKAGALIDVADLTYKARFAAKCKKDSTAALKFWEAAATADDNLPYIEPPYWYYNVRSCHGQYLLDLGKFQEAQAVFEEDLKLYRQNGWSLKGLELALKGQNIDGKQLKDVQKRLNTQWKDMDEGLNINVACF